jgi:hypothetical protein
VLPPKSLAKVFFSLLSPVVEIETKKAWSADSAPHANLIWF